MFKSLSCFEFFHLVTCCYRLFCLVLVFLGGDLVGDLKAYRSIYKELALLIQFCDFNKTGCVKIVKKHDKGISSILTEELRNLLHVYR